MPITRSQRFAVISAALLALFLGAMDALIMSAAMPTVVAELGGLHLYAWVYSAYFLSRAVSLPVFGKLADLYKTRNLFITAISIFILSSMAAGFAWNMMALIMARIIQGIGAGGIFALVYVVLADVSEPEQRGRTLSFASAIWGIASVIGPTLGGFIVTWFSWRWIFFINIPLGVASIWGISAYLVEIRQKKETISLDFLGVSTLSTAILSFLFAFLLGGRTWPWLSMPIIGLLLLFIAGTLIFIRVEQKAKDPILPIEFFKRPGFRFGNGAVFLSSFAIFSMFAFAPLFIQGAQGKSPMEVGLAMLSLSLGWSVGSVVLGQVIQRVGRKYAAVSGAVLLVVGCAMTLGFSLETSVYYSFSIFFVIGTGMGFVALSTLLVVQSCVDDRDLGVATASNQFARTLGGTVGVGACGSFIATRFSGLVETVKNSGILERLPSNLSETGLDRIESLLRPEVQAMMPMELRLMVQEAVTKGVTDVFRAAVIAAMLCLLMCLLIPKRGKTARHK